jgi:hypothetical protein
VLLKIGDTPVVSGGRGEVSKPTERVTVDSVTVIPAP